MNRLLRTNPIPRLDAAAVAGTRFITLQTSLAARLGVPHCSLNTLASEVLRQNKIVVADAVQTRHTLRSVIARVISNCDPAAVASRISVSLNIILRTGIDPEKLIGHDSERVRQVGRIAKAYVEALREKGLIDKSESLRVAAEKVTERQSLTIFGYHRARHEEIRFIDAIAGEGSVCHLPVADDGIFTVNREWSRYLLDKGWRIESGEAPDVTFGESLGLNFVGAGDPLGKPTAAVYPNVESEVRGVLTAAKSLVLGGADVRSIAVVCRDQEMYAPVIAAVATEYCLPVEIRHTVRVANTAFGGFVRLMLDAAGLGLSYESAARLAMHPFGPGLGSGDWTAARSGYISGIKEWSKLQPLLEKMEWPESQPLSGWIGSVKAAFDAFGVRVKAAARPREILAYDRFFMTLYAVNTIEGGSEQISLDKFSAIASEVLADDTVRFQPSAGGIAVTQPEWMVGAEFDHVFVVGMAEGIFPSPIGEDAVIDFFERRLLRDRGVNFADAAELARWEDLSFYFTLLAGRKSVNLSYPGSVDNGERVKSGYFARLGIKDVEVADTSATVSSVPETRTVYIRHDGDPAGDEVLMPARWQYLIENRRESSAPYDEYDGVTGIALDPAKKRWSVSQLTTIGQCRFRWFSRHILRLKPVDEIDPGMDYTKRGTFYHRVLELAVGKAMNNADIRAGTLAHLEAAFAEAEDDPETELPMLSNWKLQRSEHIRALRKAVEAADFIRDGSRVEGLEKEFILDWEGFAMKGYIDRIDNTPDGLIAIDYKTSSVAPKGAKDEEGKLSIDIQIPIYANVALKHLYPKGELGNSIYYSLTKGKVLREEKPDDFEKLTGFIDRLRADLAAGNFAVDPDVDLGACTYCDFDAVCRKGSRLERKNIL